MTKDELELLLKQDERFDFFFDGIADTYGRKAKPYTEHLPRIDFKRPFQDLPGKLYKYIDFDGGVCSIRDGTLQFSHPLSFREHIQLGDSTEFWFDRLYFDNTILRQMKELIDSCSLGFNYFSPKHAFLYLLHHHVLNIVERNKVLCLTKSFSNRVLWNEFDGGICIEYDTDVFRKNDLKFTKRHKYTLVGNHVLYVDQISEYPVRFEDDRWISNLIFVKKRVPFSREEEYRILYTMDFDPIKANPSRIDRIKKSGTRLLGSGPTCKAPVRPKIDRKYISKVYFTKNIQDEGRLLDLLEKHEIPAEKIDE